MESGAGTGLPDAVVESGLRPGAGETRHLDQLRGRDERLRDEQVLTFGIVGGELRGPLRIGEDEALELSNGSPDARWKRLFHISPG